MCSTVTLAAALALALGACEAGQPEQEQNLSERGSTPSEVANTGAAGQANMGDTMPDEPAGPRGNRGSGTGGDSTATQ